MGLETYRRKRDFAVTAEPPGEVRPSDPERLSYLVQKHAARRLHYDFRLELDGVLLSWAVPKGPSLDPADKRLAVRTEDHPIEYGSFEGTIPKGEYGGGTVMLWDRGTWRPLGDPHEGLKKGHLKFELRGERLRGAWHLVRSRRGEGSSSSGTEEWLLFKGTDDEVRPTGPQPVEEHLTSVVTGRTMDQIAAEADRVWTREGEQPGRTRARDLPNAVVREVEWPLAPALATLGERAPAGDRWLHELKLDGYRILARVSAGRACLVTRSGQDWTTKLRELARDVESLPEGVIVDGELVAADPSGRVSFSELQQRLGQGGADLELHLFDLLAVGGVDLRDAPLLRRKELLLELLGPRRGRLRYVDHVLGQGERVRKAACELGAEGIVSKKADCPYRSGRGRDWIKVKCRGREDFVVGGFVSRAGSELASLLLGERQDGALRYVGRVGTGFTEADRQKLRARLETFARDASPFVDPPAVPKRDRAHWVEPRFLAEVAFAERTRDGIVRQASFLGLREDRPPIVVSSPEKVLFPEAGITKGQLAEYIVEIGPWLLPHVEARPLSLVRCPEGEHKPCFFQKHRGPMPPHVQPILVPGHEEPYITVRDVEGLVALIQMGTIEIHPWGSRAEHLDRPDRIVFDLDPDEALPFDAVAEAALEVRQRLDDLGLRSFVRWSGGKGLHVVVPIAPQHPWEVVKPLTRAIAESMVRDAPDRYVATATRARRKGKIFVDWLRNGANATAIATWSPRAKPTAPIAAPLAWDDLGRPLDLPSFTVGRLHPPVHDPWEGFAELAQPLSERALALVP